MQALGLSKPGASPEVQLCLESLTCDPQLFAILDTLRDARALSTSSEVLLGLATGPLCADVPAFNSLSEVLCQRLHQAGFELLPDGNVFDSVGQFSFLACSFGELCFRLHR